MTTAAIWAGETQSGNLRTAQRFGVRSTNSFIEFDKDETNQSIPARFQQQVAKYSHRIAVKIGDVQFTYLELNQSANRIARAIVALTGSEPEPVALLMQQGADLIAAIFGVLKAGKSYVPLDPSFAGKKLASMLGHSQSALIITDKPNRMAAERLSNGKVPIVCVDEVGPRYPSDDLDFTVSPDAIAYILYTSGSTGEPKGVFQSHRNVLYGIRRYTNGAHLCAHDRLSLLISASFGASITDIFGALLNGAALFPFNLKRGLLQLKEWLQNERITVYHSVPTVFRHFVDTLEGNEAFAELRLVKLGGETVYRSDFEKFKKHFPRTCLFSVGFGATEFNTICQLFCDHESTFEGNTVPVGYVTDDTEILLFDDHQREVRPGDTGEIAIRSNYLALGYWRQPELTEKSFRVDPNNSGSRIYFTGDLGRMLPDGCLLHLGRKDFQIKIRGHRIEPNEIESALRQNPLLKEALVVGRERQDGQKQLVAYIVPAANASPSIPALRDSLKQALPEYMVPSAFVMLNALPLTGNGKVDRNALPAPGRERPRVETQFVSSRNSVESRIAEIWSDVLGVDGIGVLDNFFSLGGDSLSAVQLVSQVSRSFQVEVDEQTLIEAPTIAALVQRIEILKGPRQTAKETPWTSLVSIQRGGSRPPLFVVPGGVGSKKEFLVYARVAHYLGPDYPCYGLRARGSEGRQPPHASTEEMAAAYIREILSVQPQGPYFLVGECIGGIVAYEMAQQLLANGRPVAMLALLDTPRPTRGRQLEYWWRQLRERVLVSRQDLVRRIIHHWRESGEREAGGRIAYLLAKCRNFARRFASVSHMKQRPPNNEALREMWQQEVLRTGYVRTLYRYHPKPYAGEITMLLSEADARTNSDSGWRRLTAGGLTIHKVPGNHFSYIRDHAAATAERLRACLENATEQFS